MDSSLFYILPTLCLFQMAKDFNVLTLHTSPAGLSPLFDKTRSSTHSPGIGKFVFFSPTGLHTFFKIINLFHISFFLSFRFPSVKTQCPKRNTNLVFFRQSRAPLLWSTWLPRKTRLYVTIAHYRLVEPNHLTSCWPSGTEKNWAGTLVPRSHCNNSAL